MKTVSLVLGSVLLVTCADATAATSCDEVKSAIAAKLDAKGVKNYSLDVVASADVGEQKVIGSCNGGTQKIVYKRGTAG
jgi:Protein of unknown function (DUF1161)